MPRAPRLLVCAATRAEYDACERGLRASGRSRHEMLLTGVGPQHAGLSLSRRLANPVLPQLVVSSGFAGALSPCLPLSSWITGVRVFDWNGVIRVPVEGVALAEGPPGLVRCDVLSSTALVSSRMIVANAQTPVAVDMESAALARAAARRGIRFAIVRMISDTPAHPLPSFLEPFTSALSATTTASRLAFVGRGVGEAITHPGDVLRLARESAAWLRDLESGWRHFADWPIF